MADFDSVSHMATNASSWELLLHGLAKQRNAAQADPFRELIASHRKLRDGATASTQLAARVQQLEAERSTLEAKLQRASGGKGAQGVPDREAELEQELAKMQKRLNDALVVHADYYKIRFDLQKQDEQVALLQKRVGELEHSLKGKTFEYEESVLRLNTQASDREKTLQVLRGQLDGFQRENDKMRNDIIQKDNDLQRYQLEVLGAKEQLVGLHNEIMQLEQRLIEARAGPSLIQVCEPSHETETRFTSSTGNLGASFGGAAVTPSYVARSVEDAHNAECYSVAVSDRGPTIWTGGNDKVLRSWDGALASTGSLQISSAPLCMDALGDKLIVGSPDGVCRLFDTQTRRTLSQLTGHSSNEKIQATYFTPTGSKVVSASGDRSVKLWDLHSSASLSTFMYRSACLDLSASHSTICTGHFDSTICVWDQRDGKQTPVMEMRNVHDGRSVVSVRWTSDFNQVVSLGRDNRVRMFDCRTAQASRSPMGSEKLTLSSAMMRVSISPDSGQVACGSSSGALFVWSLRSPSKGGEEVQLPSAILEGQHKGMLPHALWLPDGRSLVSIGQDRRINLWK